MESKAPEAIQVVVRVRPWNEKEREKGTVPVVHTDNVGKTVSVVRRSGQDSKQVKEEHNPSALRVIRVYLWPLVFL